MVQYDTFTCGIRAREMGVQKPEPDGIVSFFCMFVSLLEFQFIFR